MFTSIVLLFVLRDQSQTVWFISRGMALTSVMVLDGLFNLVLTGK
jgi:hypothetical protein